MTQWGRRKDNKQAYPKTQTKGVSGSGVKTSATSDIHLKENKQRFKEVPVWKFDEAPEELKQKILDKHRDINVSDAEMLTDGDWLLDYEIFDWNRHEIYFDLDRGQYIQFNDLIVKDPEKFRKLLRIPKSLWNKIDYKFENDREYNTRIEFNDSEDIYDDLTVKNGEKIGSQTIERKRFSNTEIEQLDDARDKFRDMIHEAWVNLRDSYEAQISDEGVAETLRINEYDFDENGDIA